MNSEKQIFGSAQAFTFFLASIVLHLMPGDFGHPSAPSILIGIFLVIGFVGLGHEIGNWDTQQKGWINNLFYGAAIFILWHTIYTHAHLVHFRFVIVLLNYALLIPLFIGLSGVIRGALQITHVALMQPGVLSKEAKLSRALTLFVAFVGFVASALQIMQFIQFLHPSS